MTTKQQIQNIKTNVERTIQGLRTNLKEFRFQDTNGFVKQDTLYSVYYTLNKKEIYLTGITSTTNSRIIRPIKQKTLFGTYSNLDTIDRESYPKPSQKIPSESDYRIGEITRYFTQKANDKTQPIFEINKETFDNQNSLYNYTLFQWKISGLKKDVERDNTRTIRDLEKDYPDISTVLFPLQLWTPPKDSKEDLENKLSRLKK